MGSIKKTRDKLDRALPRLIQYLEYPSSERERNTLLYPRSIIDQTSPQQIYITISKFSSKGSNQHLPYSFLIIILSSFNLLLENQRNQRFTPPPIISYRIVDPPTSRKQKNASSFESLLNDGQRERERALTEEIRSIVRGKREEAEGESDPDDGHRLSRLSASIGETRGRKKGRREGRWRGVLRGACAADFTHGLARPRYILLSLSPPPLPTRRRKLFLLRGGGGREVG